LHQSCSVWCEQGREIISQRLEVRALKCKLILIVHSGGLTPYAEPLGTRDACMAANIKGKTTASRAEAKKQAVNICWQCEMYKRWPRSDGSEQGLQASTNLSHRSEGPKIVLFTKKWTSFFSFSHIKAGAEHQETIHRGITGGSPRKCHSETEFRNRPGPKNVPCPLRGVAKETAVCM